MINILSSDSDCSSFSPPQKHVATSYKVCDVDLFCLQFVFVFWGERGISSVISILGVGEHFCLKTFLRLSNIRFLWKSAENFRGQCPPLLPGTPTAYGGM